MSPLKSTLVLLSFTLFGTYSPPQPALAEIICARVKSRVKQNGKVATQLRTTTVAARESCPKKFVQLADTDSFQDPQGLKGDNGGNGSSVLGDNSYSGGATVVDGASFTTEADPAGLLF